MQTYPAEIPQIVRAYRKDEEQIDQLIRIASDLCKDLLGHRLWIRYYRDIAIVTRLVYYSATTLSGLQTLGEEYLALIPIDHQRLVPSFARRAVLIFLYVIAPPLCTRLLASVHSRLLLDNRLFGRFDPNPRARQSIDAILKFVLTTLPTSVTRAHLALFYIYGVYYHLSWRTTGTRHLTFRPDTTNPTALRIFRWLGYLSIFQLAFSCALWIGEHVKSSSKGLVSIVDQTTVSTATITCRPTSTTPALSPMIPHRVFVTGIQPTGMMHIGNYFGFIEQWLDLQRVDDSTPLILSIVDLHAITTGLLSADQLRSNTRTMVASLLACGIDPNRTILFRQSDVPEHTQLAWLLAALCTTSQLQRMPQFREKSQSYRHGNIPVCLLTYPVLQAADILLYRGTHVPVGDDQTTHMQMSADIATHFNNFYQCQYFPIPIQVKSPNERIKSLRDAQKKMSKSDLDCKSRIEICDPTDVIMEKCKKALTDCGSSTIGNDNRPAVNNLFQLYAAASRLPLAIVVDRFRNSTMSQFKPQLAYEIDARFAPIRVEFDRLMHQMPSDYLTNILNDGATKARQIAVENMREIRSISGFL